jgi:hypothetical protein
MKVTFHETGGFVPIARGCTLDTDAMPQPDADTLRTLVAQSGIMTQADFRVERARDVRQVMIRIEDGERSHEVMLDVLGLPQPVMSLIDYLRRHSANLLEEQT